MVLPGGIAGTPDPAANKCVTDTVTAFVKGGKHVGAICAAPSAPSILALLGLWRGGKPRRTRLFRVSSAGATVLDEEVVVNGLITTSYGPGSAITFALELVRQLAGSAEADHMQNATAYGH